MNSLLSDLRFALRGFAGSPLFTAAAVLSIALAMAGTAAVFALLNALLLRPLPVERPGELVSLELRRGDGRTVSTLSFPQFTLLREEARGLAGVAAHSTTGYGIRVEGEPEHVAGQEVSGNYFDVLGVRPELGRFFVEATDDVPGAAPVAVVSHRFWKDRLGGGSDALGRSIQVNGNSFTVVGVAPAGFTGTVVGMHPRIWIPIAMLPLVQPGYDHTQVDRMYWLTAFARVAPGLDRVTAEAGMTAMLRGLDAGVRAERFESERTGRAPAESVTLAKLTGVTPGMRGVVAAFLALLLATALLVLLIAAVNVTSMLLARMSIRRRELAIRRSLGASRARVVRQLLTESTLLFLLGGGLGLLAASWLTGLLPALLGGLPVPLDLELPFDARVIGFAVLLSAAAGLAFGLVPALHGTSAGAALALREGAASPRGVRLRSAFVVAQIATCLVLLVSAGLLVRSLQSVLNVDFGFDPAGVAAAEVDLAPYGYDAASAAGFMQTLRERLEAGGAPAGIARMTPLMGFSSRTVRPEGVDDDGVSVDFNAVDDGYFATLRVPLLAGRYFDDRDRPGSAPVVIVNEAFARRFWPGRDPLGMRIEEGPPDSRVSYEVIGVVPTGIHRSLEEEPRPFLFYAFAQQPTSSASILARSPAGAAAAFTQLRMELRALDPDLAMQTAGPLTTQLQLLMLPQRVGASVVGSFGMLGVLLAAIGIYGLMAFTAAQRTREIGVRIALGARKRDVLQLIMRSGSRLLFAGTVIGLVLALAAAQALRAVLHGTTPWDPVTFLAVPTFFAAVALLAAYLPARRASRIEPMAVLRGE